ncbi:hypothetical protein AOQ84DRAFT_159889 [Glonium stellatum]|uniref:Uncharacterized protein n=1 Tax=Glonium stellatum TaxID=574774 RepID=A0A8E2JZ58_9PEZI|nr:hypothetical protein AOQ84DRAFT_159889 [Glonium stellatum]
MSRRTCKNKSIPLLYFLASAMSNRRDAKRRAPHATITVPSNSPHGGSIPEQLRYGEAIDSSYRISPSHMSPVEGTHTPTGPPGRPKPPKTSRDSHGRTTHQRNKSAEEAIMREVKESETSDASEPPARDDMQYADVESELVVYAHVSLITVDERSRLYTSRRTAARRATA